MSRALACCVAAAAIAGACGRDRRAEPSTTTLVLRVTDGGKPVAARVLLLTPDGEPLHIGSLDMFGARQGSAACAIAPSVVGSWDGLILGHGVAEVPVGSDACNPSPAIPYGRYQVWAWRGVEYELWKGEVDLSANRGAVELAIPLQRVWTPHGTLAADLHVHAFASADSHVPNPQRVIAQAAAGIQVVALSDHDTNGDLDREITELGLDGVIASIASNELTHDQLHVGVYPVTIDRTKPNGGSPSSAQIRGSSIPQLFELARTLGPIVQLNHPRFRYTALFDTTAWDGVRWPPPFPLAFDAVEVLAGYSAFNVPEDRRFDEGARDFYTLIDHGRLIAPLGNSDTHDLNWVLDGTTRTYVTVDDPRTHPFDEAAFVAAIKARRTVATSGPWLDVEAAPSAEDRATVGPGESVTPKDGKVALHITLAQASFVHADRLRVTVGTPTGPQLAATIDVPAGTRSFQHTVVVDAGTADTWIGVVADGDTPLPLPLTGTYQRDKWKRAGVTPFAIISPILVDADVDGRWKRRDADVSLRP